LLKGKRLMSVASPRDQPCFSCWVHFLVDGSASVSVDKTVYIRADQRARYEKVTDVVDFLRAGGVDSLGLLTEQIQDKNGPDQAVGK